MPDYSPDSDAIREFARQVQKAQAYAAPEPAERYRIEDVDPRYRNPELPKAQAVTDPRYYPTPDRLIDAPALEEVHDETPDERTQRFARKAAQNPGPSWANSVHADDRSGGELMDVKDPGEADSWANLGQRMTEYPASLVKEGSPTQKATVELAIMRARNAIDQKAIPAAHWAKNNLGPAWGIADRVLTAPDRARNPVLRSPSAFTRSDENDNPVKEYRK